MKYKRFKILTFKVFLAGFLCTSVLSGKDGKLENLPPVVLRTFPMSGYNMVDPATKKIKVTFNQKMMDKSWSWVMQEKSTFPEMVGQPEYDKALHTCVLTVNLEPDKTYIIWINSGKFMNFKGQNGKSAVPYLLAFRTAGKDFNEKKQAAVKSAESWLKLLSEAKFEESWTSAAYYFQTKVKQHVWARQIAMIYSKVGKLNSRKLISANYAKKLPDAPEGEYFILRFASSYENRPESIETVTPMLDSDGKWKISGYYIK